MYVYLHVYINRFVKFTQFSIQVTKGNKYSIKKKNSFSPVIKISPEAITYQFLMQLSWDNLYIYKQVTSTKL